MSGRSLVLFGTGELAEVAAYYFEREEERTVAAFSADADFIKETTFAGRPVVAFEDVTTSHPPSTHDLFVATGYAKINGLREAKCLAARERGYTLPSYISRRATIFENVAIGWNCFILEDNTLQPFARIGNGVTLWSGNHIGHHSTIGDFAFIASHVVISGGVSVGARSFIGVNATTNDHIKIGARCVIGSGALITTDVPDEGVMTAEPAVLSKVPSRRLKGF